MYENPYARLDEEGGAWHKANFHTHAGVCVPGKCGELPLDDVVAAYRRAKYDVLAISNHNMFLPRAQDYEGIRVLDAVEYSTHPHMVLVGERSYEDVPHQQAIDHACAQGGFAILCHPNWMEKGYLGDELLTELTGFTGLEILNPVIYRLKGSGLALDTWERLLSAGRLAYGFAGDDFHHWRDLERAYNVIYARSGSLSDIREAVQRGAFYVSSGVALRSCTLDGQTLHVEAGFFIPSYIEEFTYRFTGEGGRLLLEQTGSSAALTIPQGERYVRVEVTSECGSKLYLQPICAQGAMRRTWEA